MEVFIETGKRRTFAGSVYWPGWCRWGKGEQAALESYARSRELMEQAGAVDDLPELNRRKAECLMATGEQ